MDEFHDPRGRFADSADVGSILPTNVVPGRAHLPQPKKGRVARPQTMRRPVGGQTPEAPIVEDVQSKFRWDVDVGKYFWQGSGGGTGGALNVAWGGKGGTASTPIVVKDAVSIEGDLGAPGKPRTKRVMQRTMGGGLEKLFSIRGRGSTSHGTSFSRSGGAAAATSSATQCDAGAASAGQTHAAQL